MSTREPVPREPVTPDVRTTDGARADTPITPSRGPGRSRSRRAWAVRIGILLAIALIVALLVWRAQRPVEVTLVAPTRTTITETVASSGRVGGATETLVGAQAQGVVERLYVDEGETVKARQVLAIVKNDVAEAQVAQAEQAVRTARAQVALAARGPLLSEVEAAEAQVRQAEAQVAQQNAAIAQARTAVAQARAQSDQLEAERDLAARQLERNRALVQEGAIARADYDQAQTNLRVAQQRVAAQRQAVEVAQFNVRQAQAALASAQANLRAQQARLKTVLSGARAEDVQVARQRLRDAEQALRVARRQAANAVVTAPFAGTVTQINAEVGQTVGAQGVLKLVSGRLEIRLDVDENNLADIALGQTAIITSSTFANSRFEGRVTEIGAAVDVSRGTVQLTVTPNDPPSWLRPGQTLNVNVVTARDVERLLVPPSTLARAGNDTVVFRVERGVAVEKPVVTRPATDKGVPVLSGLNAGDRIVRDAGKIKAGQRVRVGVAREKP